MNSTEIQEKLNALNARKSKLKTKVWFRLLEVVYWLALIISGLIVFVLSISDQGFTTFFWGSIIVFIIFTIIKKVGYYIIIGNLETIKPDFEHTLNSKLKNNYDRK